MDPEIITLRKYRFTDQPATAPVTVRTCVSKHIPPLTSFTTSSLTEHIAAITEIRRMHLVVDGDIAIALSERRMTASAAHLSTGAHHRVVPPVRQVGVNTLTLICEGGG